MKKWVFLLIAASTLSACGDYKSMTMKELANSSSAEIEKIKSSLSSSELSELESIAFRIADCHKSWVELKGSEPEYCSLTIKEYLKERKNKSK